MTDPSKDIKNYEKDWFSKAEKDSENLFNLALKVTEENPSTKVIILKRLERFDSNTEDPLQIKRRISSFANNVYDQLWSKSGSPNNIQISKISLGCSESLFLKQIIMGNPGTKLYDGVHLRGTEASRHFTYRAMQAIKPVSENESTEKPKMRKSDHVLLPAGHNNCAQAKYQRRQSRNSTQVVTNQPNQTNSSYRYNVPTQNSFSVLGNSKRGTSSPSL
jgi:hypothetical protein